MAQQPAGWIPSALPVPSNTADAIPQHTKTNDKPDEGAISLVIAGGGIAGVSLAISCAVLSIAFDDRCSFGPTGLGGRRLAFASTFSRAPENLARSALASAWAPMLSESST
jgi:hypothetical protein